MNSESMKKGLNGTGVKVPATLCELLTHNLKSFDRQDLLNAKINGKWESVSSKQFFELVKHTALGLYSLGVRQGDKVAILSENSPQWVINDFAITFLGAATVPIYVTQMPSQVEYILKDAGVKVFFISNQQLYDRVKQIFPNAALDYIVINYPFATGGKIMALDELRKIGRSIETGSPEVFNKLYCAVKPETIASVIYTSGTTGEPKGVVLTHKNLTSNAVDSSSVIVWDAKGDVAFSYLPLSHIFERTMINIYLYRGVRTYFAESIEKLADNLKEVHPTIMSSVPRMLEKVYDKILQKGAELSGLKKILFDWSVRLANNFRYGEKKSFFTGLKLKIASTLVFKKWREALGGRMRFIISGGAPLSSHLAQIYMAAGIPIVQGYGLTETSPVIAVNTTDFNKIGSVGKLIPNVEVRIAEDGEILTRGPNIMKEFYNAPEATKKVFVNGWFCTGDIGYLDSEGYLFITDRKKDLIKKSSGKFIAPGPIENKLSSSSFIDFAVLAGEGRKFVLALIFPNFINLREWALKSGLKGQSNSELIKLPEVVSLYQQIIDKVNLEINPWERIIKFLLIEDELSIANSELTPTLKVRRRIIEAKYKDRVDKIYEQFEFLHDVHMETSHNLNDNNNNPTRMAS